VPDVAEPPIWLAEAEGELLVQRLVRACGGLDAQLVFAVRAADVIHHHIDSVIELACPGGAIVSVRGETQGAACTALLCTRHLDGEEELLILNANEFLDIDYAGTIVEFRRRGLDGGVAVFPSIHPRYSCVRLNNQGLIVQAAEKHPISRHAVAGFYWFRHAAAFLAAAQDMIRKDANVNGMFYISLVLNELVLKQARLGVRQIDRSVYHPLKSPSQVARYEAGMLTEMAT
jgi:hypothetical protein